jgi:hypothetical protein
MTGSTGWTLAVVRDATDSLCRDHTKLSMQATHLDVRTFVLLAASELAPTRRSGPCVPYQRRTMTDGICASSLRCVRTAHPLTHSS